MSSTIIGLTNSRRHRYNWEIFIDNAKHRIRINPFEWAKDTENGVGEIMLTSIDNDGLLGGFDLDLINHFDDIGKVPHIVSGGAGKVEHVLNVTNNSNCSGVVVAMVFITII